MKIKHLTILSLIATVAPLTTSLAACNNKPLIEQIYDLLKTPYKYGAVLKIDNFLTDSPTVFYDNGRGYMSYIRICNDTQHDGYETYMAESEDLIHGPNRVKIFSRDLQSDRGDSRQIAGYMGFINNDLFGDYALQTVNDHHYISYLGGALDGYEQDPLSMGEAGFTDVFDPTTYTRFDDPILSPTDPGAREGEKATIYKSNMFIDEAMTLGHRYVNFYNAKSNDGTEGIFIAVSDDAETGQRYGDSYVFKDETAHNTADPIILKYKDTYIMVYYILKDGKTYDNFAISKDLMHWEPGTKEPLIYSTEPGEDVYAHKPSIVYKDGILYHFYCAVNSAGERFIAVATSKPLN